MLVAVNGESRAALHQTLVAKIVSMIVLLLATVLCAALPFMLNRCFKWTAQQPKSKSANLINFMLQLSGGVLLATTFLHLLPEVNDVVDHLNMCNELPSLPFALPETLMCGGFFLIFLLEAFIHAYLDRRAKKMWMLEKSKSAMAVAAESGAGVVVAACESCQQQQHSHTTTRSLRGLLIVIALSLHEIFEGMAIGLEQRSSSSVWLMFGAVAAHKLILAFCLGVEIIVAQTSRVLAALYVLIFAVITPIGIGIGILLSHNGVVTTNSLAAAILQGLACGTLLYVVFFEILKTLSIKLSSLLATFVGFLIMFGLQMFDDDGDSSNNC